MDGQDFPSRRDSRKRKRVSERRRVFGRHGFATGSSEQEAGEADALRRSQASYSSLDNSQGKRSDSPSLLGDNSRIAMKIQFHIVVAPENEPLILDASNIDFLIREHQQLQQQQQHQHQIQRKKSSEASIGEQIHEKLSRQNTLSTRRRQQLLAMHNKPVSTPEQQPAGGEPVDASKPAHSLPERLAPDSFTRQAASSGREHGVRSSTISGGMSDEETVRFLAKHQQTEQHQKDASRQRYMSLSSPLESSLTDASSKHAADPSKQQHSNQQQLQNHQQREHIYFKRDGQRFGHEFTLKLSIDRTYRCLLKVRPLIPLQGISIQGNQIQFIDCSQSNSHSSSYDKLLRHHKPSLPNSAPPSSLSLNRSWQNVNSPSVNANNEAHYTNFSHRSSQANTAAPFKQPRHQSIQPGASPLLHNYHSLLLYQQQQNQMLKNFSSSHCSSTNSVLGKQLIYMFDWSAQRFDVNKNKDRTQIQTTLKFKNGQILSLPLQVKFYQPNSKQHLSWGSQLHFIDYDCSINNLGNITVDRIQYY